MTTELETVVMRCRTLEIDHSPDGWPAIQMKDISALCDAIEKDESIFKYRIGQEVIVKLSGDDYTGKIVSRLESHTGGIRYAVYAKYKHATEGYWFSEREIQCA